MIATLFKYGVSTVLSMTLTLGLPLILHHGFGVGESTSVAIAFATAYAFNFVSLRSVVFQSKGGWRRDFLKYAVVNGLFRIAEFAAFVVLRNQAWLSYELALIAVLVVSSVIKFFAYRAIFGLRVSD